MTPKEQRAEYMRQWRRDNAEMQRIHMLSFRARGDGWEQDPTDFVPETPLQSRMWAQLLAGTRP